MTSARPRTPPPSGPIGVFDSGVGGLTVLKALEAALPEESLVYLGDTARVPYGPKSAATVVRYSLEAARFLKQHKIKLLVIACNSASSVALAALAAENDIPVLGVIHPGAQRAVAQSKSGKIGVIGTRATINSEAYQQAIRALRPEAEVLCRACPLFVPLAEEGWTDNEIASKVAESYLSPFRQAGIDTLVLGCTHYPLLHDVIGQVMGPDVTLVDSAESVTAEVARRLASGAVVAARAGAQPRYRFFVTDDPEPFQVVAERFLGRAVDSLERVQI